MKLIVYPSRIKKDNLGDILINVLLIRELSKEAQVMLDGDIGGIKELLHRNNESFINIKTNDNFKFLDGLPLFRWIKFSNTLNKISFVFDPPGHYSQGTNKNKFLLKSLKYIYRASILKVFKIKVVRIGVTLGPFDDYGWNFQRRISKSYHNISVRDSKNLKLVNDKGLENVSLINDLAFLYNYKDFIENDKQLKERTIVISFRGDIEGKKLNNTYVDSLVERINLVLKYYSNKKYKFLFTYQVKEDLESNLYLISKLNLNAVDYQIIEKQLDYDSAINLYYTSELVLTNRLHVALLAMLNNTPAIVITDNDSHHKLVNVYKDLGLNGLLMDKDLSTSTALQINDDSISNSMLAFNSIKVTKQNEIKDHIKKLIFLK